jgi:hypothetical protein
MMKVWRRRSYYKLRDKRYNLGLRSDGLPRLTDRMPCTADERRRRLRKSQKARRQRFIAKRHAQGLSARGKPLKAPPQKTELQKLFDEVQPRDRVVTFDDIQSARNYITYA